MATDVHVTDGAVVALERLLDGDKLEREHNRSKITWTSDGEALHHLTFKNLEQAGALKRLKGGRSGFVTFGLSPEGRKLARQV